MSVLHGINDLLLNTMKKYLSFLLLISFAASGQQFSLIELSESSGRVSVDFSMRGSHAVLGDKLFFDAYVQSHLPGLWYTDGTTGGTAFLYELVTEGQSDPVELFTYGNQLLICGRDLETVDTEDDIGVELWISDGTTEGTRLLKDIWPGAGYGFPQGFTEMQGVVYFFAQSGTTGETKLWKTDGTEAGTVQVSPAVVGLPVIEQNGTLYFRGFDELTGWELWKSDGTEAGTTLVKDVRVGSSSGSPFNFVLFNDKLHFSVHDGYGTQLYVSDGTEAGTYRVKDLFPGSTPDPNFRPDVQHLTVHNGRLYFTADDGIHGRELWVTDGTEAETVLVKDINPGTGHGLNASGAGLVPLGNELYFAANDGVHGKELWKSDGTEEGTVLVKDILEGTGTTSRHVAGLKPFNGKLYFSAMENTSGSKLFESDGTAGGTLPVAPTDATNDYPIEHSLSATVFENGLFFTADFHGTGQKLWRYGGEITNAVSAAAAVSPGILVYPSPSSGRMHIRFPHVDNWQVRLYNMQGAVVFSGTINQQESMLLNSENNPAGIYTVVCTDRRGNTYSNTWLKIDG